MKINYLIGISTIKDVKIAIASCFKQIETEYKEEKYKDLITIVIATENYDFSKIAQEFKKRGIEDKNIGFSTPGIIHNTEVIMQGILICNIYSDKKDTFYTEISEEIQEDTYNKGKKLAKKLFAKFEQNSQDNQNEKTIFLVPDVIASNIQEFLDGIYFILGTQFPLFGGGVGLNKKKEHFYQMYNSRVYQHAGIALMMDIEKSARKLFHGYKPLTKPFIITKSNKNIIEKIDGEDAYTRIKSLLNLNNTDLKENEIKEKIKTDFPLGMTISKNTFLIRVILNINDDNEVICANDIPEQSVFYIMQWKRPKLMKIAIESSAQCQKKYGEDEGNLLILVDCISRFESLKLQRKEEIIQIRKQVKDVETIGFLSYGEIGAIKGNKSRYHNKSVSFFLI
jgi:hypothetical protein